MSDDERAPASLAQGADGHEAGAEPMLHRPALVWTPWAWLGGLVWASSGLLRGASMVEFGLMIAGGALTLWFAAVAVTRFIEAGTERGPLLAAFGITLAGLALFGKVLLENTHHRPLGAVTFAVFGAASTILVVGFFLRCAKTKLLDSAALGWVLAAVGLGLVIVRGSSDAGATLTIDLAVGASVLVAMFQAEGRVRSIPRGAASVLAGSLVVAAIAAAGFVPPTLSHPVVVGLPALLR